MRTPLIIIAAVILIAVLFYALATTAEAQPTRMQCGERAVIVAKLAESYGESQRERRVNDKGTVVYEFWASKAGSWTLLTTTRGVSCLVAAGGGWKPEDDT